MTIHSKETLPGFTKNDEGVADRRSVALALFGALGGAAFLEGCAAAGEADPAQLGSIAQAAFAGTPVYWVDTVLGPGWPLMRDGDLANKTSAQLGGATIVIARGSTNAGDGGGGVFWWDTSSGSGNDGTIITVPGTVNACWRRIYSGPLNVKWFGAKGNGTANDWGSISNTIACALGPGLTTLHEDIYFPPGTYRIASKITPAPSASYLRFLGSGKLQSQIVWGGVAGQPMMLLRDPREITISNLGFVGSTSAPPSAAIESRRTTSVGPYGGTGYCRFEDLLVGGLAPKMLQEGIVFTCDPGGDSNNEQAFIERCTFSNITNAAIRISHLNSQLHSIHHCAFDGFIDPATQKQAGVAISTVPGPNTYSPGVGGGFSAYACTSANLRSTFELAGASHEIRVHDWSSENDDKLVTTPSAVTTAAYHLRASFHNLSWQGNDVTPNYNIDADMKVGHRLVFRGGSITAANGLRMRFGAAPPAMSQSGSLAVFDGVWFQYTNAIVYNNTLVFRDCTDFGEPPTITNLGAGIIKRDGNSLWGDVFPVWQFQVADGSTPDLSGTKALMRNENSFTLNYFSPATISNFLNGVPGQRITLWAANGNITLQHTFGKIELAGNVNWLMPPGAAITLLKLDQPFGFPWREISRRTS